MAATGSNTTGSKWGFTNRVNRVPYYQRLFQRHDGLRQWQKTPKSKILVYPFYASFLFATAGSTYMMGRMFFGHKTWL